MSDGIKKRKSWEKNIELGIKEKKMQHDARKQKIKHVPFIK